jgi:hypothetical protein
LVEGVITGAEKIAKKNEPTATDVEIATAVSVTE